jgi:hypothetical protein
MAGPYRIKQTRDQGIYEVLKHGQRVAILRRSDRDEVGHDDGMPWLLVSNSGRIDRHPYYRDAVDEAHKL